MDLRILLLSSAVVLAGATEVVAAQSHAPRQIAKFKDWAAYTAQDEGGKQCFANSLPTSQKYKPAPPKNRDQAYFMVTIIPSKKIKNEVSTTIGYVFKEKSTVTIDVEGKKFTMFTKDDSAWMDDTSFDTLILKAMKTAKTMTVEGVSKRGTTTTDTYSLSGLALALEAISKECAVK